MWIINTLLIIIMVSIPAMIINGTLYQIDLAVMLGTLSVSFLYVINKTSKIKKSLDK